jgi:dipeptidyl aminopeptidase/acylaminoacyl peptidase
MVGEADENVDPATTMQVVNALIKADKDFDLLVSPGSGHGVARTPYGERRLRDFFVKNLIESDGKQDAHNMTSQSQ